MAGRSLFVPWPRTEWFESSGILALFYRDESLCSQKAEKSSNALWYAQMI